MTLSPRLGCHDLLTTGRCMCWRVTKTEEAAMKEVIALFEEQIVAAEADTGKGWPVMLALCVLSVAFCLFMLGITVGDILQ